MVRVRRGKVKKGGDGKEGAAKKSPRFPSGLRVGVSTSLTGSVNFFVSQLTFFTRKKMSRIFVVEELSSWLTQEAI